MIFIGIKNRACEKTSLPLKSPIDGFIRWPLTPRLNRRIESRENRGTSVISFGGFITADHNRRLRPRYLNQLGLNSSFHSVVMAANQTAVSPLMVKPKEKPRHSPKVIFTLNQAHFCACVDVSEQCREMNYKTQIHTTRYNNKVQV